MGRIHNLGIHTPEEDKNGNFYEKERHTAKDVVPIYDREIVHEVHSVQRKNTVVYTI